MLYALKRLTLGVCLIILAGAVLLVADWGRRSSSQRPVPRVALFQFASRPALDDTANGIIEGLRRNGFAHGSTLDITRFNAQGDFPTANSIARGIEEGGFDLVITASTPALQAMAAANKRGRVKHVFATVTDPMGAGVGINSPTDHPAHLCGIGTFQPVRETIRLAKSIKPDLETIGEVWCPSEQCSEACTKLARDECAKLGIRLMEAHADNTNEVLQAAQSLASRGVQAIWIGGDNTVEAAAVSVIKAAREAGIPVFTNGPTIVADGALFALGADYYIVGQTAGDLAARILKGADPARVRIDNVVPRQLAINEKALIGLRENWAFPTEVRREAAVVYDSKGALAKQPVNSTAGNPITRKWRLYYIQYAEENTAEAVHEGLFGELKKLGVVEGRDFVRKEGSAQRDMATLINLLDDAKSNADVVFLVSTPTLQTALKRISTIPMVFSNVGAPLAAGVGKSFTDHAPNVTGVCVVSDFEGQMKVVKQVLPNARTIGTLFTPSEVNSVVYKDGLEQAAEKAGYKLIASPVTSSADVADAALALMEHRPDVICQISDNTVNPGFAALMKAARQAKIPVFSFVSKQVVSEGSVLARCRDYEQAGRDAARMLNEVLRGKNPKDMPIQMVSRTVLVINTKNAEAFGVRIPEEVIKSADQVVDN
jgi:ABC-type uncharacterized transport system substrate-binding protein